MKNGSFTGLDLPERPLWSMLPAEAMFNLEVHDFSMVWPAVEAMLVPMVHAATKSHIAACDPAAEGALLIGPC